MIHPRTSLSDMVSTAYCGSTNNSGAPSLITAAGTGDNTAVTGAGIDRAAYNMPESAAVNLGWLAALSASQTLSLAVSIQESADNSSWDTAEVLQASTVVATGAGNKSGVTKLAVNLKNRKRYFRINFTPDLSAGATDTALVNAVAVMGGAHTLPAV